MYLKPPRSRKDFRKWSVWLKLIQKANFPTQGDDQCVCVSSEKIAGGGSSPVKGRRYLFSLKIKPLTLFLVCNRAEQVKYSGRRSESILFFPGGKTCLLLRGILGPLWWLHNEETYTIVVPHSSTPTYRSPWVSFLTQEKQFWNKYSKSSTQSFQQSSKHCSVLRMLCIINNILVVIWQWLQHFLQGSSWMVKKPCVYIPIYRLYNMSTTEAVNKCILKY